MTRTLELTPEQEDALERKAFRAGMTLEDYLRRVIEKQKIFYVLFQHYGRHQTICIMP